MIPWTTFETEYDPDWRIELNEFNLHHYVKRGPNQLTRGLESPMLELAHERQFAIAQLGLVGAGFESEHAVRINLTLKTVFDYFDKNQLNESYRPTSPYREQLADLRLCHFSSNVDPLPSLEMDDPTIYEQQSPSPVSTAERTARSPLALVDLTNPEPVCPRPTKRKYSSSHSSSHVDVDGVDSTFEVGNEILYQSTSDYIRAIHPHTTEMTRTYRATRRRLSPMTTGSRGHSFQQSRKVEQAKRDASLLLGLSKDCA